MVDALATGGRTALLSANERHVVFVTANPCPKYRFDLWTQHRQIQLFTSRDPEEILAAVRKLHDHPNQPAPPLSLCANRVAWCVAR